PNDLDVHGAGIGRHSGVQWGEPTLARRRSCARARLEEGPDDLSSLEEGREPERREPIRRNGVRLRAILPDNLANARRIAGRGCLEHVELRSAPQYRRRDVALSVVERDEGRRETVLVTCIHQSAVALEKALDRSRVAALDRGEEIGGHQSASPLRLVSLAN